MVMRVSGQPTSEAPLFSLARRRGQVTVESLRGQLTGTWGFQTTKRDHAGATGDTADKAQQAYGFPQLCL
jgi:hypothetical protein